MTILEKPIKRSKKLGRPFSGTPMKRSKEWLAQQGFHVEQVEHFNFFSKRTHDLLGFIDLLAFHDGVIVGVQACARGDISTRRKKILEHKNLVHARRSGLAVWIVAWDAGHAEPKMEVV